MCLADNIMASQFMLEKIVVRQDLDLYYSDKLFKDILNTADT